MVERLAEQFVKSRASSMIASFRAEITGKKILDAATLAQMQKDPVVKSSLQVLRALILAVAISDGWSVVARDQSDPQAVEIADFVRDQFNKPGMNTRALQMARALLVNGHAVAEVVYKVGLAGLLEIDRVKVLTAGAVAWEIDEFGTVVGFKTGVAGELIPVEKFWWVSNIGETGDLRGDSALEAAHNWWFFKTKLLPEFLKFLQQFGTPLTIGVSGEDAPGDVERDAEGNQVLDEDGNPVTITPEDALLSVLMTIENSTAIAVPHGTTVETLQSEGEGQAFLGAMAYADRQIAIAILGNARTILEAEHGSKADSTSSHSVTESIVSLYRAILQDSLEETVFRTLVTANFGPDAPIPRAVLSSSIVSDRVEMIKACVAAFQGGLLTINEIPAVCAMLGLPQPDIEALRDKDAADQYMRELLAGEMGKARTPLPSDSEAV